MPLNQDGLSYHGGDIDRQLERQITQIFSILDQKIRELSEAKGLSPLDIKYLQPLHHCVLVGDAEIFVVLSVHDAGGVSISNFLDWSGKEMNMPTAIFLAERDLAFRNAFGINFSRSVLDLEEDRKEEAVSRIAERYVNEEIVNLERLRRIVRMNPIFQGRDFLLNEQLVFVLSPFGEPFDNIFADHIKPSIESLGKLKCVRADDIYDNQSIIEDIWRYSNEAKLLISELTGRNANVFYETGIAHTIGKDVILITQSMDDVPFDLRHLRCIVYEYTPPGIRNLEDNLKNTALNILAKRG